MIDDARSPPHTHTHREKVEQRKMKKFGRDEKVGGVDGW